MLKFLIPVGKSVSPRATTTCRRPAADSEQSRRCRAAAKSMLLCKILAVHVIDRSPVLMLILPVIVQESSSKRSIAQAGARDGWHRPPARNPTYAAHQRQIRPNIRFRPRTIEQAYLAISIHRRGCRRSSR
jgi:hypothetical protein